jgi:hypothetical protein
LAQRSQIDLALSQVRKAIGCTTNHIAHLKPATLDELLDAPADVLVEHFYANALMNIADLPSGVPSDILLDQRQQPVWLNAFERSAAHEVEIAQQF